MSTKHHGASGEGRRRRRRRNEPKRKRIESFRLDEISLVDRPAQEPALITLMKREDGSVDKTNGKVEKSPSISDNRQNAITSAEVGHSHLVAMDGRAGQTSFATSEGEDFPHAHPFIILEDGTVQIGESEGHSHTIAAVSKNSPEGSVESEGAEPSDGTDAPKSVSKEAADGGEGKTESSMSKEETTPTAADLEAVNKKLEDAQAEAALFKSISELSDAERSHYNGLDTDDAKSEFLGKSAEDRKAVLEKAQDSDPVVYKSAAGVEYRQSDDSRLVEMAKNQDLMTAQLQKAEEKAETTLLEKRATNELGHLPGELGVKVQLLKAVEGIDDEEVRKGALAILKSKNDVAAPAFRSRGISKAAPETNASDKLAKMAQDYAKEHTCDLAKAYTQIISTPEGEALYEETQESRQAIAE